MNRGIMGVNSLFISKCDNREYSKGILHLCSLEYVDSAGWLT